MLLTKLFLFLTIIKISLANIVDSNITNVNVYINKISSCNYNSVSSNLLCATQEFETLVQFHKVNFIKMCDYHYCVMFKDEHKTISCSGYLLKLIGGDMNTYINALSPNDEAIDFTANSDNVHPIGKAFKGYNVLIESFVQNVQTTFEKNIVDVDCGELHSTCVRFEDDGEVQCFGANEFKFYDSASSLIFGLLIPGVLSLTMYLLSYGLCWTRFSRNYFVIFILIPIQIVIFSMLILFQAERFIVKTHVFMIGSIFGIIIGHVLSNILIKCLTCFKDKKTRVDMEENIHLTDENAKDDFVIGDDGESSTSDEDDDKESVVTIELNKVDNKLQENDSTEATI